MKMVAKQCDRCGKFFNIRDNSEKKIKLCIPSGTKSRYNKWLDLCQECEDGLGKWLDEYLTKVKL